MGGFISYELLPIVFNMSVTASAVIVFVLLARLLLRKAPKIFSYALWAVVLFRLLCPVSVTAGFSLLGLLDTPVTATTPHTSAASYIPRDVVHAPEVELPLPGVTPAVSEALPQGEEQTAADPLEAPVALASLVWLAGIGILAAYSAVSLLRLRRRLVGAVPLKERVYLADHIDSPFVMGLLRPRIYLPSSLSEREQGYIILHERHHIRRGDHIIKALAFLALCVHWFNPLVWAAFVLSAKDMEMSCDEAVVKQLGEGIRADYSASLLSLATGRRIIAGTPLAFGEGDTKSRIRNLLSWKRPKVWITVLAAAVCVVIVAACAANPRNTAAENPKDPAAMTGQFASMEAYAQQVMEETKTVPYYRAGGGEATANVTGTKLAWLEKQGEVTGLAPEGTLEAWTFNYLVRVDASPDDILLMGGMYEEDGWYDLEGQGGRNIVALRYADGSYDILYNAVVNDNMDFYGYHNSYEEAVYDWYVTENRLDLPLYVEDWTDRIGTTENDLGNFPVHRFDGDGWYLYIPVSGWKQIEVNSSSESPIWGWGSAYDTGAALIVTSFGPEVTPSLRGNNPYMRPLDSENRVWEQQGDDYIRDYFTDTSDGGCWRVSVTVPSEGTKDPGELEVLYAMAESFTLDARMSPSPSADSDPLADSLAGVGEGDPLTLRLTLDNGPVGAYDDCWSVPNALYCFHALQSVSWAVTADIAPAGIQGRPAVTLSAINDWSLTAYEGLDAVRFTGPTGEWWLVPEGEELSAYGPLREWFDEAEYAALGGSYDRQSIVIPDEGQGYLQAAGAYVQDFESIHLQASPGSKFRYSFVAASVEGAEEITAAMREHGEIGENTYCFYLTTVFVPQNESARQWSMAGNTGDYTGSDPGVPKDALEDYRCGYITLEDDGWHGQLVGTGW